MPKILVFLLLTLLTLSCSKQENKKQPEPLVKTIIIGEDDSLSRRTYPGRVLAGQKVDLAFQVSGTLKEFPVKEGIKVAEHDLLAQLDARDFQNRYDAAKAQLTNAQTNYQRGEVLVKSKTIAQASFDELRSKYESAKSNANIAEKALQDTTLYAPFGGLIARTYVNNYQEVQAKEKIMSLQNVDDIDIIIDVPEQDLINQKQVREGNKGNATLDNAYVTFDTLGNRRFDASIKEYATEADPTTQTYRVTLTMKAPTDVTILPGMTANLVVMQNNAEKSQAVAVPINAVGVDADGKFYVWEIDEKTLTVHKKIVEGGELRGDNMNIISGLHNGDRIVTAGVPYLEEGMKVRLFKSEY